MKQPHHHIALLFLLFHLNHHAIEGFIANPASAASIAATRGSSTLTNGVQPLSRFQQSTINIRSNNSSSNNNNKSKQCNFVLFNNSNNGDGGEKKGYKFGDFTKGITKSLIGGRVSKITGKPYQFGDLSRKIDESIKDKISDVTGKDDYEFGDLSRYVDTKIKGEVNKFTNNDSYKFGDLSKEIVRKVFSGEYTLDDLFILLKAMALCGASLSPVAGFLPVQLLIELLNFSLVNDVAGRVTSGLAMEVDRRLKKSLLGNENYQLGDATKSAISSAVTTYTGKDTYSFGDVTKKVVDSFSDHNKGQVNRPLLGMKSTNVMEPSITEALDKWDGLSEKELENNLMVLEQYVDKVEKEQSDGNLGNKK